MFEKINYLILLFNILNHFKVMIDIYQKKKIKQIKEAKSDEELAKIIDDIYNDGEDSGWYCANKWWW